MEERSGIYRQRVIEMEVGWRIELGGAEVRDSLDWKWVLAVVAACFALPRLFRLMLPAL